MIRFLITLFALMPIVGLAQVYNDQLGRSVPALGLDQLLVDVEAGSLEIVGLPDATEINVTAIVWIEDHPKDLERTRKEVDRHVRLDLTATGSVARLITRTEDPGLGYSLPHVDLVVTMPRGMALTVKDESGYIEISDIDNDVSIVDDSGSIDIRAVGGEVDIDDGSGSISVANTRGPIRIDDGSGSIDIEHVRDDVSVHDGSGSISVLSIRGDVTIYDGSGSITVDGVRGDVRIPDSGSGSVSIGQVAGLTSVE